MFFSVNPFIYSRAVKHDEFIGRVPELRRLLSRTFSGQSTAILGQPHIGKTSLLKAGIAHQNEFGAGIIQSAFSLLDVHSLHGVTSQTIFWELALSPLVGSFKAPPAESSKNLIEAYQIAQASKFAAFELENFLGQLSKANRRLVLLLDEFDDFLSHSVLNCAEFYGSLRSLASRSEGLVLVIAARKDLEQLNQLTQQINPHGSPYFNVFTEIKLGAFSLKDMATLLDRAGERFNRKDREYVEAVSGRHPFLAQAAAAMLWEAYEEGKPEAERYEYAANALYQEAQKHFADTWRLWSHATRKVVTAIVLVQIPQMLEDHKVPVQQLLDDIDDYAPELQMLRDNGVVADGEQGQWHITQGAFLWWLADELRRNIRDDKDFTTWLRSQEMEEVVKSQERQRMGGIVKQVSSALGKGATTLIEAFAKGFGEGTGKALAGSGSKS